MRRAGLPEGFPQGVSGTSGAIGRCGRPGWSAGLVG
ncbi:hypothetical protein STAFG_3052 [Streptomyces afghaniensis 772]|uniref:Uncharacterized protein n=1 Tax=Streptomyces afghaniensis 772 TaxID=1283301 RepID=S4MK27_9ACTN|nr:hypothetical protein STAFG_3052 [Streptomyces afghaniensis 772]